jgi:hypothetical protein
MSNRRFVLWSLLWPATDRFTSVGALLHCGLIVSLVLAGYARADSPEIQPESAKYPHNNQSPTHVVTARLIATPDILGMKLQSVYETKVLAGCYKSHLFSGGEFGGTPMPLTVRIPIALSRAGNSYEGSFTVDRFLPGTCEWHFSRLIAVLSIGACSQDVVIAKTFDRSIDSETAFFNTSDAPSHVRVRTSHGQMASCAYLHPGMGEKTLQGISEVTRSIEVNIEGE